MVVGPHPRPPPIGLFSGLWTVVHGSGPLESAFCPTSKRLVIPGGRQLVIPGGPALCTACVRTCRSREAWSLFAQVNSTALETWSKRTPNNGRQSSTSRRNQPLLRRRRHQSGGTRRQHGCVRPGAQTTRSTERNGKGRIGTSTQLERAYHMRVVGLGLGRLWITPTYLKS